LLNREAVFISLKRFLPPMIPPSDFQIGRWQNARIHPTPNGFSALAVTLAKVGPGNQPVW
jgi:hypothetical protein